MRNLLYVIDSLDYGGAARRLCLLAAGLPRDRFRVRICVLGEPAPWGEALRQAGVEVRTLGRRRPFDLRPFLALRRLIQELGPDLLHGWGRAALRALPLGGGKMPRVVSGVCRASDRQERAFDRWLLRCVRHVAAFGPADAERYRRAGIEEARITTVTPGIDGDLLPSPPLRGRGAGGEGDCLAGVEPLTPDPSPRSTGERGGNRTLLCVGPIEARKGHRDAVWAFDILQFLYEDLRLVFVGDGADRPRVEDFARGVGAAGRVRFVGRCADVAPYFRQAAVVWAPSRAGGGVCVALEAMAAGRPVVAARTPGLDEVVADGESGFLIPPGDKAALARRTRQLLDDDALRRRFGAAARARVADRFDAARMVRDCAALYDELV